MTSTTAAKAETKSKAKAARKPKLVKLDVYKMVTDRIIGLLDEGTIPWRKPWKTVGGGFPCNRKSKKDYRGINICILAFDAMAKGFSSRYWMTFNQSMELAGYERRSGRWVWPESKGGKAADPKAGVKKGEHGSPIVFFKWKEYGEDDDGKAKRIPFLRYYTVFNLEQTTGIATPDDEQEPQGDEGSADATPVDVIAEAEAIVNSWPGRPTLSHGGNRAYYSPKIDHVKLPERHRFAENGEAYYSVLFHELAHATGHEIRLNRVEVSGETYFGDTPYSREELVAEFGAAFLCSVAGIENKKTIENSAAYIAHWKKKLTDNPKWVVNAAAAAQKASDWILGAEAPEHENGGQDGGAV